MTKKGLALFDANDLPKIIKKIGWKERNGKLYYKNGKPVLCECCKEHLTIKNVGGLMKR